MEKKIFNKGALIVREGNMDRVAYLIISGSVEISKIIKGQKRILGKLGRNEIFGEMSLFDSKPRSATVKALVFATKKPLVGISSLDVLAMNVKSNNDMQICTLCDAKRDLLYCCLFKRREGRLIRKSAYFR